MAIDTAERRNSMMNFCVGGGLLIPDGSIDTVDRFTLLELYSGVGLAKMPKLDEQWDYVTGNTTTIQVEHDVDTIQVK